MSCAEAVFMRLEVDAISYSRRVRGFTWRRLRDWDAAEDAAQETLRRVLQALRAGVVRSEAALLAFMLQTARHVCCHHIRAAQRERRALARLDATAVDRSAEEVQARLTAGEELVAVRWAMARLEPAEKELLRLEYGQGLSLQGIAARLKLHPTTLRVQKHRLLRRLRRSVGERLKRPERRGHLSVVHDHNGGTHA